MIRAMVFVMLLAAVAAGGELESAGSSSDPATAGSGGVLPAGCEPHVGSPGLPPSWFCGKPDPSPYFALWEGFCQEDYHGGHYQLGPPPAARRPFHACGSDHPWMGGCCQGCAPVYRGPRFTERLADIVPRAAENLWPSAAIPGGPANVWGR